MFNRGQKVLCIDDSKQVIPGLLKKGKIYTIDTIYLKQVILLKEVFSEGYHGDTFILGHKKKRFVAVNPNEVDKKEFTEAIVSAYLNNKK